MSRPRDGGFHDAAPQVGRGAGDQAAEGLGQLGGEFGIQRPQRHGEMQARPGRRPVLELERRAERLQQFQRACGKHGAPALVAFGLVLEVQAQLGAAAASLQP
ncbi:MAG TPA: hypothetical protein VKV26_10915 [Dehalococcoidia bacterium]|nr:hypothetical protein [Dehalococcoidia bacterium]